MTSDQPFCLRWNNHQKTLVEFLNKLVSNERLADCTVAAEGQYIKAHKVLLSACSPYFELLLSQHNDNHPIIILKDVSFLELKDLMNYMYRGEVNVSQDQLGALLKVANNLQIKGLSDSDGGGTEPKEKPQKKRVSPLPPPPPAQQLSPIIPRPGLTIEHQRSNQHDLSLDSPSALDSSPMPRERKRKRRRSGRPSLSHTHIGSHHNSSTHEFSSLIIEPIFASTPVKKPLAVIPNQPALLDCTGHHILQEPDKPNHQDIVHKTKPSTEMLLEPNRENLTIYMNEDISEDLTLEDGINGLNQIQAGLFGTGSSVQGFNPWRMASDRSTDEVFMQAQQSEDAQRDSQESSRSDDNMNSDSEDAARTSLQESIINLANEPNDTSITIPNSEDSMNSDSADAARTSLKESVINLSNEPNDTSITIPNSEETNSGRKDPFGISSLHVLKLETRIQKPDDSLIKKRRILLQSCDDIVGAGSTSAKKQITMSETSSHLNTSLVVKKTDNRHMKDGCGRTKSHKCPQCQRLFGRKAALDRHTKDGCGRTKSHKCPQCQRSFGSIATLDRHMNDDCGRTEPHKCPQCQRLFGRKATLDIHMKDDCGRTEPHKCPYCQRLFGRRATLDRHMKDDCGRTEPHKCPQCQRLFFKKQTLVIHMKDECGRTEPHKCPQCQRLFNRKATLDRHMKDDCGRTEPHKCPQCQRLFDIKATLDRHMKNFCSKE